MVTRVKRSPETQRRFEQGRVAAKQRVIERGIVAFRSDSEMMELLLKLAEYKRVPYGVLARSWVMEGLRKEAKTLGLDKAKRVGNLAEFFSLSSLRGSNLKVMRTKGSARKLDL